MEGWSGHVHELALHTALFHRLWDPEERLLHINVLELQTVRMMLLQSGGGFAWSGYPVQQHYDGGLFNTTTVAYTNKEGSFAPRCSAADGSLAGDGQCSGRLPVLTCGRPHGVVPGREVGEASLRDVVQATDRPVFIGQQYPSPSLVQSGLSSRGYHSECIFTT